MNEYQLLSLSQICSLIKDGTHGTHPRQKDGIPLISAKDVRDGRITISSDTSRISREEYETIHRAYEIKEGDLLISLVGSIGRCALVTRNHGTFSAQRSVGILRSDRSKVDPKYLYHATCDDQFQQQLLSRSKSTAQAGVYLGELAQCSISLPPFPEQKKIAGILSGIDRAIAKLIYKSQKLGALQASLTEEFVQELQGKMDLAELQEYAEVRTGVAKNAKSEGDMTEMPYMRVANVQDGFLDLSEVKTISIDRGRIQRYLLQTGDVLINEGGDLDKVGRGVIWRGVIKECLHQNHVFAVRCSERLMPEFLSLLLKSAYSKNYFLGCAKQTTNLASINSTQLNQFPVPLPDLRTQEQFISHITSVKELNSAITNEISGLEATKKAVASDLLSGRKRVSI